MSGRLREAMQQRLASRNVTPVEVATPVVIVAATASQRFVRSPVFVMLISVVVCLVMLLAMRPPFVLKKGDPVGSAFVPALLWSLVAGAVIIAIPAIWVGRSGD